MNKKYCLDTSGFSNPLEAMPQDIHVSLWNQIKMVIASGNLAVTQEIFGELRHIQGGVGECIMANEANILLEIGNIGWPFEEYIEHAKRMQRTHAAYIRENCGGKKSTIGMNDLSIIALAKTLSLPVVSMEKAKAHQSEKWRQIPDVCALEQVAHMTFNDFLRAEGLKL